MSELLQGIAYTGSENIKVSGIASDSRRVQPDYAFIAVPGFTTDGHQFIPEAIDASAGAIVQEQNVPTGDVPCFTVPSSRKAESRMAAIWFNYPANSLNCYGITGTNGKTTVTTLLWNILNEAGSPAGSIGTLGYRYNSPEIHETDLTTPDAITLHTILAEMQHQGIESVVMEVSSHALALARTTDIPYHTAIFTNLGRDHLDFHHSQEAYRSAKAKLFQDLSDHGAAVLNMDSPEFLWLAKQTKASVVTYAIDKGEADYFMLNYSLGLNNTRCSIQTPNGVVHLTSALLGRFNLSNMLAAVAAASINGVDTEAIRDGIQRIAAIPGRLERVDLHDDAPTVFVDYAHTPDALESALSALADLRGAEPQSGRIFVVFGCGGDREKKKRPEMGAIAAQYADDIIITSDNPRSEDPLGIIHEILTGVDQPGVVVEPDRRKAIHYALAQSDPRDLVLIAGKGHEPYQVIKGKRLKFDDKQVVQTYYKEPKSR